MGAPSLLFIPFRHAVVSHISTTQRLVTCKINDDADMSPAGLLLLVSRDGSRKEVDCDPRMGLVRILSSTRGGYSPVTQEDKLGFYRASYRRFIYVKLLFAYVWFPWFVRRYPHRIRALDPSSIFHLRISTNSKCRAIHYCSVLRTVDCA